MPFTDFLQPMPSSVEAGPLVLLKPYSKHPRVRLQVLWEQLISAVEFLWFPIKMFWLDHDFGSESAPGTLLCGSVRSDAFLPLRPWACGASTKPGGRRKRT